MENNLTFARKYRPRTMEEYMGDAIKKTVMARFSDQKHYPHVILLYGSRGTGKTSMARLLAKEYLCQEKTADGHACGKCWACQDIEENLIAGGNQTDGVMEFNIATDGGKSDIEEMLHDAMVPPMPPLQYKIVILDECHMATAQAQNAMLKIVEEPPEHLVFIFCTTNPEKMITPLKSRCQLKLEVKRPTIDDLAEYMLKICQKENFITSIEALKVIAKKAGRIPREALSLLENVSIEYAGKVTLDNVRNLTGEVSTDYYMKFFKAANNESSQVESLLKFVQTLKDQDISCKDFINGLIRFTLDCMYIKYGISLDDYPIEFAKEAKKLFNMYTTEELDVILQIIEYAIKLMNSDDNRTELILLTTGLRIGKAKKLSFCISNSDREAAFENVKSTQKTAKNIANKNESESKSVEVRRINGIDDNIMSSIFGSDITEISLGKASSGDVPLDSSDIDDESNDTSYQNKMELDLKNFLQQVQDE